MNMRPLIIGRDEELRAAEIVAHALAHPYIYNPKGPKFTPGDHPEFVGNFGTYRAVFTFTHAGGAVFRHLSVSVPGKSYPNPFAVWTLCDLFGFTGWHGRSQTPPEGWACAVNGSEHCVTVGQKMVMQ